MQAQRALIEVDAEMHTPAEAVRQALQHHRAGRLAAAERIYRKVLEVDPEHAEALLFLGVAAYQRDDYALAAGLIERANALSPSRPETLVNLGAVYRKLGRTAESEQCYRAALAIVPSYAQALCNLGMLLRQLGRQDEAERALRQSASLEPANADFHNALGVALKQSGRHQEAEHCFREALALRPEYAGVLNNLAETLRETGRGGEAVELYRRALALEPGNAWVHSSLLLALSYLPGPTLAELLEEHAKFERRHAIPLYTAWVPHENAPDPERVLRLGFVSPDLGAHPIGHLMTDMLREIDRRQVTVFVYSTRYARDLVTEQLRLLADRWCEAASLSDDALATRIRADGIDVLFDLSGHTRHNRLLVFARKPAPVQVTWMGYACTTGLRAIDYLITDGDLVPPEFERFYAETVVRLPGGAVCFRLPDDLPPVGSLPALRNGFVTFGCFNNPAKVTPQAIGLWCRVLALLPKARLVLKFEGFDDSGCRERYSRLFAEGGIDPSRVTFLGRTPMAEMLACYNEVDIAMDPFPYTGGTTTFLALAMGVPVVTLVGETMASRQSYASLRRIGVVETIAASEDEYVERALALGRDLPRLAGLRGELRGRLLRSPMFDAPGSARVLERAVRELWRRWCASHSRAGC